MRSAATFAVDAAVDVRAGTSPSRPATTAGTRRVTRRLRRFADADWIVNSRNIADEHVVRPLASLAGFEPRIAHRADSLELVQDLIVAGLGVGLLPAEMPLREGVGGCRCATRA